MIYNTAQEWLDAPQKRVLLFGMSGLGKTHLAHLLRSGGGWFHYSVDYRIGTRYMGEHIVDNFKKEAMKTPFLADLLRTDSIYIASNITFNNLAPLSTYLGKPGSSDKGGLAIDDYQRRQEQHRLAEVAALMDSAHFITRAKELYDYDNFVCDSGGSICEVVDPNNPDDPVLGALSENMLMVWIEGDESHNDELARRFDRAPKPMYYQPEFLAAKWQEYLILNNTQEDKVDPNDFVRWTYAQALSHRQPRYREMAKWGVTIKAHDVAGVSSADDFNQMIAAALAVR